MIPRYRAWDSVEKKFVEHFFITDNGLICNMEKPTSDYNFPIPIEKSELILMQSTGLKDKNGKEIFEGDILACKTDDEVINLNIFWDEEHALFMFESKKYNEQEPLAELVENNTYPFEIIGNIYENPELLEDKE